MVYAGSFLFCLLSDLVLSDIVLSDIVNSFNLELSDLVRLFDS